MDTFECIRTKFEVRNFDTCTIPAEIKLEILEAARSTGTGLNTQHWRFIFGDKNDLSKMRLAPAGNGSQILLSGY